MLRVLGPICIVLVATTALAEEPLIPEWVERQSFEELEWPKELHGSIDDGQGSPVPNARVTLKLSAQIYVHGGPAAIYEKTLLRKSVDASREGRYSFPTADFPKLRHRPLSVTVSATAPDRVPWKTWFWLGGESTRSPAKLHGIGLRTGRLVSGTCVDSTGRPVAGALLHGFWSGDMPGEWAPATVETDREGRFETRVPDQGEAGFWVSSREHAPQFVKLPSGSDDQPFQIVLEQGVLLKGIVKSSVDEPHGGVVVVAETVDDGDLPGFMLPYQVATRTDDAGRFQFPPLHGQHKVYVTEAAKSLGDDEGIESEGPLPAVLPLLVSLDRLQAPPEPTLVGDEFVTLEGAVTWNDGTPASSSTVCATVIPDEGPSLAMGRCITDSDGQYLLQIPNGITGLTVYVESRRRDGEDVRATSNGVEYVVIGELSDDSILDFRFSSE